MHLVFSTKDREPFITSAIEAELHPYMATIFRDHKSPSLIIDGTADHIHALFALGRTITIAELVEEVKTAHPNGSKRKDGNSETFIGSEAMVHFQSANRTSRK